MTLTPNPEHRMCCTSPWTASSAPFRSLNRWFATVLAAISLASLAPFAAAQEAATGIIRGKVINATNGAYLENVTVQINGTNQVVKTNGFGEYVIRDVPAGEVVLRANYVSEPEQTGTVTVAANETVVRDFTFRESAATKRLDDGTVKLDPFVVSAERYKNARDIAIAEERNAINIKNVVAIDQFGDIPSGNVGEFVKFLPGVQVDYGASNNNGQGFSENTANGVSVRGFGPEDTTILVNGLPIAATVPGNLTRQTGLDQLNINNASRVELVKVATPDMPANSAGGQINLITRSAFEYAKPVYDASIFFNISSMNTELGKTPGPVNKDTYKTSPGVSFGVSYPFSKTFGMTLSGTMQQEFSQSYRAQPVWNNTWNASFNPSSFTNADGNRSSIANPVLTRYQVTDAPAITDRTSGNLGLDWKPTPNQTIRASFQYSTYETSEAQRKLDFRPTIAAGANWNDTIVAGTTANSTVAMNLTTRDRVGDTFTAQLAYELDWKGWRITAAGSSSKSASDFEDAANGHYSGLELNLNPGRVIMFLGDDGLPTAVETFTRTTNLALDYTKIANWTVNEARAFSGPSHNAKTINLAKVDVSRSLDFIPFLRNNPLMFQFGYRRDEEINEKSGLGTGYRQVLRPGATFVTADIIDTDYVGQSPGFGLPAQEWASTYKLYDIGTANNLFEEPVEGDQAVQNWNSYVNQQKDLKEATDAIYAQLSGSFFSNRLYVLAGARQESKERVGRSPFVDGKWMYIKNADGSLYTTPTTYANGVRIDQATSDLFANNAAGNALRADLTSKGISFPTTVHGPIGTDIRSAKLNRIPLREVDQKVTGDPSFSINTAYKVTKKIDAKVAFSRSFKQQPLESGNIGIITGNNLTITEYTATEQPNQQNALGQIQVANPGLKPETSWNWDFEVAYYTDNGGKLSVSYYTKDVENATQDFTTYSGTAGFDEALTALGFDPAEYQGWRVLTSANSTRVQKTSGYEFFVSQDFGFIGAWGRRVSAFASFAMTDFPPPSPVEPYPLTHPNGTVTIQNPTVIPTATLRADRFGGAGVQYSGNRFLLQVRGTYRNENQVGSTTVLNDGTEMRRMQPAETRIDINMTYMINKTYSVFASARDVFNGSRDEEWLHSANQLPDFAKLNDRKEFGTSWSIGVKGHW
jgi:iron complex outermembrane receptor protein